MATQNTDFISGIPIYSPAAVYAYDNAGNIVSDGLHTDYFYNQNNRLIRVEIDGLTIAEYAYDAFERRVTKVVNGVTTHFHYDLNGLLISETDGNGNPRKDYVYLNGEPVAMKTYGGSAGWYWFINDHLGTPQKMVDASGSVVWAAAYAPFGEARVYKDEVTNNLRFPGQYHDVETGLHYNWHRYYDPGTGRYLRADPIGLNGGINLYSYSHQNPVNHTDPYGLFVPALTNPYTIGLLTGVAVATSTYLQTHPNVANEIWQGIKGWLANESKEDGEQCPVDPPDYPDDPSSPPGSDWEWRGPKDKGAWHKKNPKQSLRPHPEGPENPHGEHQDWKDPNKKWWRIYPDGRIEPK